MERWKAYYQIEPWGQETILLAQLVQMLHQKDFRPPHPSLAEILGVRTPRKKRQTPKEMWDILTAFSVKHNATVQQ